MLHRRVWKNFCRSRRKWRKASRCIAACWRSQPKDAIDQTFKQDLIEKFEDGGATLPPDKRKRAKEIADEIERLDLQFGKNVNEDPTTVVLTPAEAAGMPDAWLAARRRDAGGNLVLGLDSPTVVPFLQNATSEAARRKVWMAKNREGGEQNLTLLDRTLKLRYELAQLHGMPDYATYALKRRMAQTPAAVNEFLAKVQAAVDEVEARELAELRADKAKFTGTDPAAPLFHRWDLTFHQERVRRARFKIDQEALRVYFPTDKSIEFAIKLAERLFGLTFVERKVPTWHKDVRYFDVFDQLPADGFAGKTGRIRRRCVSRSIPARRQVQPRSGVSGATWINVDAANAHFRAGDQLRSQGVEPRRA